MGDHDGVIDEQALARVLRRVPTVAVGVLRDGETAFRGGGGLEGHPDPGGSCWEMGSIGKALTGILLAEMAGRGEVGLDDPIGRWAPDDVAARLPDEAEQPTLRHLATHTSGLPRLPWKMVRRVGRSDDPYASLTLDDVWAHLGPSTGKPRRTRIRYSNYGVGLLGHLLERAAGSPYPDLIRERVLGPLGMGHTAVGECPGAGPVIEGIRKGRPTPPWTFGALQAAGGLRTTPADLLRLAAAVIEAPDGPLGGAVEVSIDVHARGRMQRRGLGWSHRVARPGTGRPVVWHDGGTYGTVSFLAIDRDRRAAVVVFGNRGPGLTSPVWGFGWKALDRL